MFAREALLNEVLAQSAAVWQPEKVNDELRKVSDDIRAATGLPEGEPDREQMTWDELKRAAGYEK